jgi:Domain of unknown function (DUF4262)
MNVTEKGVLGDVAEYGWSVTQVLADEDGPAFAYTIGLYQSFEHPEILMIGLDLEVMSGILNTLGDDIKQGERYEAGQQYSDVVETYLCSFQPIDEKFYGEYLGKAVWFYKGKDFPALQCVYPDMAGRYMWEQDANPRLTEMQPLLTDAILGS